nr:MAG TPA: hypothetical protein [Caudoviricetes sp.]
MASNHSRKLPPNQNSQRPSFRHSRKKAVNNVNNNKQCIVS